ncbi:MAG TPA: hypothetical protein DDX14_03500, partial [Cyanobacteria bacterium UBA9579]|nr:hypothetical protein [Cyanobacteria bacterium UBA9579]
VCVTTGPGGINTLNGVFGQWTDSVPVLYISGQVKQETTISSCPHIRLRQLGDQEADIVNIVKPITKYAEMIKDPYDIKKILDKAIYIATHGRPGPVWIDVPMDIQGSIIDETQLNTYDFKEDEIDFNLDKIGSQISEVIKDLKTAKRPVFIAGHGIRIAKAEELFLDIAKKTGIPVVTSFNGTDIIPTDHPLFAGKIGTLGDRAGNFSLQNSDYVISIGSRNNIRQVSYNWQCFARAAKKVVIDIDSTELQKPTLQPDIAIQSDARVFLEEFNAQLRSEYFPDWNYWQQWCLERKKLYPVVLPEYEKPEELVHPYYFTQELTKLLKENDIIISGNGTASICLLQAGIIKKNQRIIWNSGCASMGYDLPAAIGASIASNKKEIICLTGDGSIQMNIQELQTIVHHKLPIKLFVFNNNGYMSIKQTQDAFFNSNYVASDKNSGVSLPNITKLAEAYGLSTAIIDTHTDIHNKIQEILNFSGPIVCDVRLIPDYQFSPKLSSERLADGTMISKPLEDMYPFLDREEFKNNMLIPEWK